MGRIKKSKEVLREKSIYTILLKGAKWKKHQTLNFLFGNQDQLKTDTILMEIIIYINTN